MGALRRVVYPPSALQAWREADKADAAVLSYSSYEYRDCLRGNTIDALTGHRPSSAMLPIARSAPSSGAPLLCYSSPQKSEVPYRPEHSPSKLYAAEGYTSSARPSQVGIAEVCEVINSHVRERVR